MAILEVNNLIKNYGSLEVLKGISFTVEKGEVLTIIGSSGSGKTTLLRCLNFLESVDGGSIIVNGEVLLNTKDTNKIKDKDIRLKRIHFGLVFQSFNLFPHYNVLKNVTLAASLLEKEKGCKSLKTDKKLNFWAKRRLEINAAKDAEKAVEERSLDILNQVGLSDKLYAYPQELSGGQQQRVAIARALALNPDILCFDEPTSALDPELTGEVLKVIKNLKSKDRTMIIVTHEMEFARNVSDKVIFMANGVIEEIGSPTEVFDNPKSEKTRAFLYNALETY